MSLNIKFNDIYVLSSAGVGAKEEKLGPLGNYFDFCFDTLYANQKTFEDAEIVMAKTSLDLCIKKSGLRKQDIQVALGGDLLDQLAISNFVMSKYPFSFIGVYGACSTSILSLAMASLMVNSSTVENALAFTSSNYGSAERQFRYPTEYGVIKKDTATITASAAGSFIVSKKKTKIKVNSATIGEVIDSRMNNVNDMGSPMAIAAYYTIKAHLKGNNKSLKDYDVIITGDLSDVGSKVLEELFALDNVIFYNHTDAGSLLYDKENQKVFSGGSGCGCLALVASTYVIKKLTDKEFKRVLLVGTGALHSPTFVAQKKDIPVVAHAIELERVDEK